jgi:hypothetical protein
MDWPPGQIGDEMLYLTWAAALVVYSVIFIKYDTRPWWVWAIVSAVVFAAVTIVWIYVAGPKWMMFACGVEACWLWLGLCQLCATLDKTVRSIDRCTSSLR